MLFGLRHPTIVRGNDKEHDVNRAETGDHIANEIFVTRDIDNSGMDLLAVRSVEIQFGKSEIDCDLPGLLFRQTIGVAAGERFDQCALAVIDVARGRDDEMLHPFAVQTVRMASTTRSSWCGRIVRKSSLNERLAMYPITGGVSARICAANWFAEQFSGWMSMLMDEIIARGNVPPPVLTAPRPTLIRAGNPRKRVTMFAARARNSSLAVCDMARTGTSREARLR